MACLNNPKAEVGQEKGACGWIYLFVTMNKFDGL